MKYLKVFTNFRQSISRLSNEEKGILFDAMLEYAETGVEPDLYGKVDALWPVAQIQIDACKAAYDGKVERAQKNGSMHTSSTEIGSEEPKTTEIGSEEPIHDKDKDKDKEKEKEKEKDNNGDIETRARASALDRRFAQFWATYPKKVGKADALRVFARLKVSDTMLDTMLAAIQQQRASPQWTRDGGQYIPNPATWLRQGRWEDETQADIQASPPRANPQAEAWLRIAERMEAQA